jgi:hypothetical protein
VSENTDLQIRASLELARRLADTAADFAAREGQLVREFAARRSLTDRNHRVAAERIDGALADALAAAEAAFAAEEERVRSIHDRRRAWIEKAGRKEVTNVQNAARNAREKWRSEVQLRHFEANRKLPQDLAAADALVEKSLVRWRAQGNAVASLKNRARIAFLGYPSFQRLLNDDAPPAGDAGAGGDAARLENSMGTLLADAEEALADFRRFFLPRLFRMLPPVVFVPLLLVIAVAATWSLGPVIVSALCVVLLAVVFIIHRASGKKSAASARALAAALAAAGRAYNDGIAAATADHARKRAAIQQEFEKVMARCDEDWERAGDVEREFGVRRQEKLRAQVPRLHGKNDAQLAPRLQRVASEREGRVAGLRGDADTRRQRLDEAHAGEKTTIDRDESERWARLQSAWQDEIRAIHDVIARMNAATATAPWSKDTPARWTPPAKYIEALRFARLEVDVARHAKAFPKDPRLALPGPAVSSIPLALSFPAHGSLLVEAAGVCGPAVIATLNNIILRVLCGMPPGKAAFTIIDPVGLGQNFAGLMHLSDFEDSLINRRIWTHSDQIEERLAELCDHIEKVIQMYLRNEYATITDYNAKAGTVAEKYHFLVVADFPANFSEMAARRLQSIVTSGPRCGVFTLIHRDTAQPVPEGVSIDELRQLSALIQHEGKRTVVAESLASSEPGVALVFDPPPEPRLAIEVVQKIGEASVNSSRVEVPFSQVAPRELWALDTTDELRIPVGRTGATKLQYLAIGKGTRQHALFAGKTGSGKSTLFHVIVTNLALACSPEQVEFYLIDFKKGVEFKCYAEHRLPHARVVAIESDREFALSVLHRVDAELRRRGDLFRKLGVQDLAGYKRAGGTEPMPRSLLIVDEFQEFFVEDDDISQTASLLLDRIVRQGRAFGLHVLLGSQTLGGAFTLARATMGQMVIRVALQCNEADSYLIMDENNSAPRLLSRPGEGIYNDSAGAMEGNSPFQVVWLPEEERDTWLEKIRTLADQRHDRHSRPVVFEGNAPADIRDNDLIAALLDAPPAGASTVARCWLGAPNSIKGPTEVAFLRQSGCNLLIVGQREETALTLSALSLLALGAQFPAGAARFVFLHNVPPGTPDAAFLGLVLAAMPQKVTTAGNHNVADVMTGLDAELKIRTGGESDGGEPPVFVFVHGLQRFRKLRQEDEFSFTSSGADTPQSAAQFAGLVTEGPAVGIHVIATVDTLNNINRFMSRKTLGEFELRVVFQMSANDSASLIESPKAGALGLHRAILYSEQHGLAETFRPYAQPGADWLEAAAGK